MDRTELKYVMVKDGFGGSWPVLIPKMLKHNLIPKHLVASAGFCRRGGDGTWKAYGKSESLGVESNPELDSQLLSEVFTEENLR